MSEIVLEITVWLSKKNDGRFKYDMNDGIPHLKELLTIIKENDDGAVVVNKFETENGGEEKVLAELGDKNTLSDGELKPFFHKPMVNSYRGTLHLKTAIRSSQPMQRGNQQREYLRNIFMKFNVQGQRYAAFDPVQEINQFRIGALVGITAEFNEIDTRRDIMGDATEIYNKERREALDNGKNFSEFQVE